MLTDPCASMYLSQVIQQLLVCPKLNLVLSFLLCALEQVE